MTELWQWWTVYTPIPTPVNCGSGEQFTHQDPLLWTVAVVNSLHTNTHSCELWQWWTIYTPRPTSLKTWLNCGSASWTVYTPRPTPLKKWLKSVSKLQMLRAFVTANKGWKVHCHFLQTVSNWNSVSCAHLSTHTHTGRVEWCGIGH